MEWVDFVGYGALAGTSSTMLASCLAYQLPDNAWSVSEKTLTTAMHAQLPVVACHCLQLTNWAFLEKLHCLAVQTAAASAALVTVYYWPFIYKVGSTPSLRDLSHSGYLRAWPHVQQSACTAQMVTSRLPATPLGMLGA